MTMSLSIRVLERDAKETVRIHRYSVSVSAAVSQNLWGPLVMSAETEHALWYNSSTLFSVRSCMYVSYIT